MKTIYTTSSFFNWVIACLVNFVIIFTCIKFAHKVEWHYLDMAFFAYVVILLFYFICLKKDEGFPALFRQFVLRKKSVLLHVSSYEVTIVLIAAVHIVRAIILYREAFISLF
ncbi:hypothetical protein [Bacillus sp. EAC]|uniref:hypothetical protein n=1 Tax=Bacillus sp. EAC TaxID=1978338 RepID=UPI000B4372E0|nr:hypothetical protein [Bacillus sp. EAC]